MEVALRWETLEAANSWDINLSKNQRVVSEHIKIGPDRTFLARDFWLEECTGEKTREHKNRRTDRQVKASFEPFSE